MEETEETSKGLLTETLSCDGDLSRILCLIEFDIEELLDIIGLSFECRHRFFPFSLFKSISLKHKVDLQNIYGLKISSKLHSNLFDSTV